MKGSAGLLFLSGLLVAIPLGWWGLRAPQTFVVQEIQGTPLGSGQQSGFWLKEGWAALESESHIIEGGYLSVDKFSRVKVNGQWYGHGFWQVTSVGPKLASSWASADQVTRNPAAAWTKDSPIVPSSLIVLAPGSWKYSGQPIEWPISGGRPPYKVNFKFKRDGLIKSELAIEYEGTQLQLPASVTEIIDQHGGVDAEVVVISADGQTWQGQWPVIDGQPVPVPQDLGWQRQDGQWMLSWTLSLRRGEAANAFIQVKSGSLEANLRGNNWKVPQAGWPEVIRQHGLQIRYQDPVLGWSEWARAPELVSENQ